MLSIGLDFKNDEPLESYLDIIHSVSTDYFKINPAFTRNFKEVISYINKPIIFDGKYGDVPHTNEKYAEYVFEHLNVDAVTLNPYVGFEALEPFFRYKNKTCFILCRTTNGGAKKIQEYGWTHVINFVKDKPHIGLVLPSNDSLILDIASTLPNPILSPGIGTQGGKIEKNNGNIIYSVSRSVIYSQDPKSSSENFYELAHFNLRKKLEKNHFIQKGKFTLSSGNQSDYYVDLRMLSSHLDLFRNVCSRLSYLVRNQNALLGVESASIPLSTQTALFLNREFGYVRKKSKDYGSKRIVEGVNEKDKVFTIIDDVLSTGGSLKRAILSAREEGYNINQALVIVERKEFNGRQVLEELGVEVSSLLKI